jgi:hypothetical protein
LSGQQLATTDHANAPDVTATLVARRGLKLPAFPVSPTPTDAAPPPGPTVVAQDTAHDRPRAGKETAGNLRRFPLPAGRPRVDRGHSTGGAPPAEAAPGEVIALPHAAPVRARRALLPAAPTEPQAVSLDVVAAPNLPLTGEGSLLDRKPSAPAPGSAATPTAIRRTSRRGRLHTMLPDSPVIFACVLLAIGALVLVWALATRPPHPYDALLFVNALGLCLAGALLYGMSSLRARREKRHPTAGRRR